MTVARRLPAQILILLALTSGSRAYADPPMAEVAPRPAAVPAPLPRAPVVVPPKARTEIRAPYPRGAEGHAEVTVELVVTKDGSVAEAHAIDGSSPFAEVATAAVKSVGFEPATRDGAPIAARIRVHVSFSPPIEEPVELPPDPYPDPLPVLPKNPYEEADETPRIGSRVENVEVTGQRRIPGKISLGRAEIRDMPGAFGDGFRAIEALPGVTPMASGLPFFFVRGAPPGSTGYFLEGIRLPVLFHLGAGPSVIHPALVDQIDFFPGSAPASYGRSGGGIVAATTKSAGPRLHGEANVRLLDAGALIETPLPNGLGSMLAAGRFGYPGLLLPLFAPNTRLSYWDYQFRSVLAANKEDSLTLLVLGSYDYLGRRATAFAGKPTVSDPIGLGENAQPYLETRTIFETEFSRVDLRHDHITKTRKVREGITLGSDKSALGLKDRVATDMIGGRVEWEETLSERFVFRSGFDVNYQRYTVRADDGTKPNPEFKKLFPARDELTLGVRADVTYSQNDRLKATIGVRADRYAAYRIEDIGYVLAPDPLPGTQVSVEPRASTRVKVVPRVVFVSTAGLASQPPRFVLPLPGLTIGRLGEGLERSVQTSHGIEWALPLSFSVSTTLFGSRTLGLADVFAACPGARNAFTDGNACTTRSRGDAFGLEVYVKRPMSEKITGFLSYTLSRSTRTVPTYVFGSSFSRDVPGGVPLERDGTLVIPSDYDRTHVLNAAVAYDIGRGYRAGLRFLMYSGRPYTPTRFDGTFIARPNSARLPAFYRFDVRLEKKWSFANDRSISAVIEGMNVTLRKEPNSVTCGVSASGDDIDLGNGCVAEVIGPIAVPSLGVEAVF